MSICSYCGRHFDYSTANLPTSLASTYCSLQCESQGERLQQNDKEENAKLIFMFVTGVISLIAFAVPLIIKGGAMFFSWIQVQFSGTQTNSFIGQQTQEAGDLEIVLVDESEPVPSQSTTPHHSQPKKSRPKQLPPALPKSFSSTKHKSKPSPPPIPETSRAKTPPPLPSKLNTIEKEPRSRLLMLVWLAALSFCFIFTVYMLPDERKQVIKWLSKKTDSFEENLSKESKEDVKPISVSQDTIADTTLQGYENFRTFADNPSQFIGSDRFVGEPLTISGQRNGPAVDVSGRVRLYLHDDSVGQRVICWFHGDHTKELPTTVHVTGTYKGVAEYTGLEWLELVDCRMVSDEELAAVIEVAKPLAEHPAQKQPMQSDARPLKVRIGTVTDKSGWMSKFNSSLENVKCHATSDQVIIDFDVDKSKWIFQYRLQLLVRLFDRNGNHLTNFTTEEKFTMFPEVFKFYSSPTKTLKARGNRLVYKVNIRDLRDAAMIEIGFSHDSP